jgi:hypothetical protein
MLTPPINSKQSAEPSLWGSAILGSLTQVIQSCFNLISPPQLSDTSLISAIPRDDWELISHPVQEPPTVVKSSRSPSPFSISPFEEALSPERVWVRLKTPVQAPIELQPFLKAMNESYSVVDESYENKLPTDYVFSQRDLKCLVIIKHVMSLFQGTEEIESCIRSLRSSPSSQYPNPPIGIIFCQSEATMIVKYFLCRPERSDVYKMVSALDEEYKKHLPSPDQLALLPFAQKGAGMLQRRYAPISYWGTFPFLPLPYRGGTTPK